MKNDQMELLEIKNKVSKMKISLDGLYSKLDTAEESVNFKTQQYNCMTLQFNFRYREGGKGQ